MPILPGRHFQLGRELVKRGHAVTVAAASFRPRPSSDAGSRLWTGSGLHCPDPCLPHGVGRIINMVQFASRVSGCLPRTCRPDIVIGSSVHPFAWLAAEKIARRAGAPFIAEVRDLWPQTLIEMGAMSDKSLPAWFFRRLERRAYRNSRHIITLLPAAHEYICSRYRVTRDKITHISNGIDLEEFDQLAREHAGRVAEMLAGYRDKFLVAYAGALGRANQMDTIIESAQELTRSGQGDVHFLICGQGPEGPRLKKKVATMGLKNVEFMGLQPYALIPALLRRCDVNVVAMQDIPLYRYGISLNKLFSYFASSKPIVFSGRVVNDMVKEAGAGISVDPEDPKAIAQAIATLRDDRDLAEEMGRRGRRYVEDYYSISLLTDKLEEIVRRCLK